jgi:8-oxo-dGTP pyrophosphatase MutT (NUDIX family)
VAIVAARKQQWVQRLEDLLQADELFEERQRLRSRYSPRLSYGRHFSPPGPFAKPAAVMVLLHQPEPDCDWRDCSIPLTVRPDYLPDHPGQISFPGGRVEEGESYVQAAVRELEEELGITKFTGNVVGSLSPIWVFNSDYRLQPFVAVHVGELNYIPCQHEVARLIQLPLRTLLAKADNESKQFSRGSVHWQANVFQHENDIVWGATAIVLAELAAILRRMDVDGWEQPIP